MTLIGKSVKFTRNPKETNTENFKENGYFLGWGVTWEENANGTAGLHYTVAIVQELFTGNIINIESSQITFTHL